MELFTFIEMGGTRERISVVELEAGVGTALAKFDGAKANCFLPKDKQKLLAVIEAGFGDMAPFNKVVRKILKKRSDGSPALVFDRRRSGRAPLDAWRNAWRGLWWRRRQVEVRSTTAVQLLEDDGFARQQAL